VDWERLGSTFWLWNIEANVYCDRVATAQEMVREKEISSRSGKSQEILF